jgi:hypothetical protein
MSTRQIVLCIMGCHIHYHLQIQNSTEENNYKGDHSITFMPLEIRFSLCAPSEYRLMEITENL